MSSKLGGGTGVFTSALIEHGIVADELLVLELNEELHQHLRHRFPDARVECGDARELPLIAQRIGYLDDGPADAVLSGLGLLSMGRDTQHAIMDAAFKVLSPEGRFVQFTYGPTCPVKSEVLSELGLSARRGGLVEYAAGHGLRIHPRAQPSGRPGINATASRRLVSCREIAS